MEFISGDRPTTRIGFTNDNRQICLGQREEPGTDHGQKAYAVFCLACGNLYGANGSDIHERKCPKCQGGQPGIPY